MEFQAPVNMQDGLMGLSALTSLKDALNGIPLKTEASGETEGTVGSTSFSNAIRMLPDSTAYCWTPILPVKTTTPRAFLG